MLNRGRFISERERERGTERDAERDTERDTERAKGQGGEGDRLMCKSNMVQRGTHTHTHTATPSLFLYDLLPLDRPGVSHWSLGQI